MCKNSLACIISLINVYNHLHSEVSQICFEGGVAKTLYIPYKLISIGVANQNNFATPPKYLRHLLTMQLKSRVKTNLRHFPTIIQLYWLNTVIQLPLVLSMIIKFTFRSNAIGNRFSALFIQGKYQVKDDGNT